MPFVASFVLISLDFRPESHLPARELKHVSRAVPMAIAAASEALEDAGLSAEHFSLDERRDFGVVLGVGRFTDGRERGVLDFGAGEAVGCSRVCRGRAILR